ncbi:MAG: hypothetical protein WCL38_01675, partial [Actinomycetota bacterium]
PHKIRVATRSKRLRKNLPDWIKVETADVPEHDITLYEGIPITTVVRAILDARAYVMPERLLDAIPAAVHEGLLDELDARNLERVLAKAQ